MNLKQLSELELIDRLHITREERRRLSDMQQDGYDELARRFKQDMADQHCTALGFKTDICEAHFELYMQDRVNWRAVAEELKPSAALLAKHTQIARVFRIKTEPAISISWLTAAFRRYRILFQIRRSTAAPSGAGVSAIARKDAQSKSQRSFSDET